jgi:Protein of unknown function (DUF998)
MNRRDWIRTWAWAGLAAQIAFVVSWVIAAFWQGPRYSALAHTISDMYAVTAPGGMFLVVVITLCGIATVLFALLALLPALRASGWIAALGCGLLALSIYGLGDALTPLEREACRIADDGCSAADQIANSGGRLDAVLSTIGIFLFIGAAFVLAEAMKRTPGWQAWAWPARGVGIGFIVLLAALAATGDMDLSGLFERLLAASGAAAIAATAVRNLSMTRAAES